VLAWGLFAGVSLLGWVGTLFIRGGAHSLESADYDGDEQGEGEADEEQGGEGDDCQDGETR